MKALVPEFIINKSVFELLYSSNDAAKVVGIGN
jgi:hypothetical protein